jgi:import inner membrane translocase subunit TIM21
MTVRFVDISAIPLPSYISYFPLGTTSCFHTFCQVTAKIGYPVTGYGNESRNRAARQRIPNKVWTDEDGVEHVEVNFYIRGPHGAGKVYSEMFKDNNDRSWKFTYLIVEIVSPHRVQLMLESYVPA